MNVHALEMQHYPLGMMLLVIDFDKREDRLNIIKQDIPGDSE